MASWDDVRRTALALPESTEALRRGLLAWQVRDKVFAWERPLRQSDLAALGQHAPDGPILAARVEHLGIKDALLASEPDVCFTTPHFNGFPAVLVRLDRVAEPELNDLLVDAWLARAPRRLAQAYLASRSQARC